MSRAHRASFVIAPASLLLVLLIASSNSAQNANEVNVSFHTFQDTRDVTVLTPTVELSRDMTDRTSIRATFGVDAISAASDSCVRCHRDGAPNHRTGVGAVVTRKFDAYRWSIGGALSGEKFYRASTFTTALTRDLAEANTTVAAGYTFSLNQPTLHPLPDVANQYQHDGFVSVTQTLSKTTIGQVGYEVERLSGYLDNPFLRTDVNGTMTLGQVPDTRVRQTVSLRVRQALPADTFFEADYRRYIDDWAVGSNAFSAGVSHRFARAFLADFSYRRYDQTGASFYAPSYTGTPQYFTADFRLAPFASDLYTGRVVINPSQSLFHLPDGYGITLQYDRYQSDNGFESAMFSAGFRVPLRTKP
jgi:hypothetical protein